MPDKFIFTITTGRSGSVFVTDLLEKNINNSIVFHERTGFLNFGLVTPDLSHFTLFNSAGNIVQIKDFWKGKFERDCKFKQSVYIETSHLLSKAGLLENISMLTNQGKQVEIIIQRRNVFKITWSLYNRFDYHNLGFTWLYYLDPRYPNKIINSSSFMKLGPAGCALWYVHEMFTRAEYYKLLLADNPLVTFHEIELEKIITPKGATQFLDGLNCGVDLSNIKIPNKANESIGFPYGQKEKTRVEALVRNYPVDHKKLASSFYNDHQRRLSTPPLQNDYLKQLHSIETGLNT